ncbi:hypothetical protein P8610_17480 [Fictibacillus sp. UD]|uniref:hypothetical protein n=1 Tax=Fictibacillus sp. UD TaxID=3038777 RepID=UPI00374655AC
MCNDKRLSFKGGLLLEIKSVSIFAFTIMLAAWITVRVLVNEGYRAEFGAEETAYLKLSFCTLFYLCAGV